MLNFLLKNSLSYSIKFLIDVLDFHFNDSQSGFHFLKSDYRLFHAVHVFFHCCHALRGHAPRRPKRNKNSYNPYVIFNIHYASSVASGATYGILISSSIFSRSFCLHICCKIQSYIWSFMSSVSGTFSSLSK